MTSLVRATDSDFYKTATNADDLKDVFSGISQDIVSAAGHPRRLLINWATT